METPIALHSVAHRVSHQIPAESEMSRQNRATPPKSRCRTFLRTPQSRYSVQLRGDMKIQREAKKRNIAPKLGVILQKVLRLPTKGGGHFCYKTRRKTLPQQQQQTFATSRSNAREKTIAKKKLPSDPFRVPQKECSKRRSTTYLFRFGQF